MSLDFDQLQAGIQFKVKEASYLVAAINETNGAKFAILVPALTEKELRNRNSDKDFIFYKEQYLQWNSKHQSNWFSKVTPRYFDFKNVLILKSNEDQLLNNANLYANDYHWYNDNQENIFKNINEQNLTKSDCLKKIDLRGQTIIISTDEKNNLIIFEQVFSNINGKSMCFAVKNSDFKKIFETELNWKIDHRSLNEKLSELEIYKVTFIESNKTEITDVNIQIIDCFAVEKAENFETKTFFINKNNKNIVDLKNNNIENFIKLFKEMHWPNNPWLKAAADLKVNEYLENVLTEFIPNLSGHLKDVNITSEKELKVVIKNRIIEDLKKQLFERDINLINEIKDSSITIEKIKFNSKNGEYNIQYKFFIGSSAIPKEGFTISSLKFKIQEITLQYKAELIKVLETYPLSLPTESDKIPLLDNQRAEIREKIQQQVKAISTKLHTKYQSLLAAELPILIPEVILNSSTFDPYKGYQLSESIAFTLSVSPAPISAISKNMKIDLTTESKKKLLEDYYQKNIMTKLNDIKIKDKEIELFNKNIVNLSQLVIAEIKTLNQNWKKNKYFVSLSEINEYPDILARLLAQYDQINSVLDLNRDKIFSYQELIKPLLTTDFAIDTLITKDNKQDFKENLTKLEVANEKLITVVTGKNYEDHIENFDKRQREYHIIKVLVNDILIAKNKNIKTKFSIIVKIWRIIKKVCYYLRNLKFSKKIAANDKSFKDAKQKISLGLKPHNSLENEKNLDLLNNNQNSSIVVANSDSFNKESCNNCSLNSTPRQLIKMLNVD